MFIKKYAMYTFDCTCIMNGLNGCIVLLHNCYIVFHLMILSFSTVVLSHSLSLYIWTLRHPLSTLSSIVRR